MDLTSISVNQQRVQEPYIIKAIGDSEYIYSILNLKGSGFVDIYAKQGLNVSVEKNKKVEIPKYNGEFEINYMKDATNK